MAIIKSPVVSRFMDACGGLLLVEWQRSDSVGVGIIVELLGWNVVVVITCQRSICNGCLIEH